MSRRRKLQEQDGDRSHIPREERSYVEYHPRLLTHLALTIVRQASDHHRRASSRIDRDHIYQALNGKALDVHGKGLPDDPWRRHSTASVSVGSDAMIDVGQDDIYALGQIITPENVEPVDNNIEDQTIESPDGDSPSEINVDDKLTVSTPDSNFAIDPALLADDDEIATPAPSRQYTDRRRNGGRHAHSPSSTRKSSLSGLQSHNSPQVNGTNGHGNGSTPSNGVRPTLSRNGTVGTSDRFLRSEVSVEEKYERLRKEEGFSIGKLHVPSFRKLDDAIAHHKVKLSSNAIAFGYQADRPFEASQDAYTRSIELPEAELTDRVEYDMDEQDDHWLTKYNELRSIRDGDSISREIFEITLTKIEKEWTALEKRIPRIEKKEDAPSEDAKCAICDDGECENTNAIVFCDGCNLAVHQACYGVPYIPEGQWLCRKCFASPVDPVSCVFCPSKQGAFKQTSDLHWAHLLCTSWIPEVNVGNLVFMEPVEGVSSIPASRWKLVCYICKLRVGACIQCSNKSCYTPFHVSCARQARLFLQRDPTNPNAIPKSFCDKHVPDWYRDSVDIRRTLAEAQSFFAARIDPRAQTIVGDDAPTRGQFVITLKRSKQNAVIPAIVFSEILSYMQKFRIRNKADFIADLCKYWSLKRRSRRGVSLLKRLQIQIEDSASQRTDSKQKAEKLEFSKALLSELDDHQRPILDELMEREILKKEICDMRDAVIEHIYLPLQPILREAVAAIQSCDQNNLLSQMSLAVQRSEALVEPVTWNTVMLKTQNAEYMDVSDFEVDLDSMRQGILSLYPEASTKEHRFMNRLDERLLVILARCRSRERALQLNSDNKTASAFDSDFEPKGLDLIEEKPFNWALRDASPLSDLDDDALAEFEPSNAALASPPPKIKHKTPSYSTSTPTPRAKLNSKAQPEDSAVDHKSIADSAAKACTVCKSRKIKCDGLDASCQKHSTVTAPPFMVDDEDEIATPLASRSSPRTSAMPESVPITPSNKVVPRPGRVAKTMAQEVLLKSVEKSGTAKSSGMSVEISTPRSSRSAAREQESHLSLKRKREEIEVPPEMNESPSSAVRSRRRK